MWALVTTLLDILGLALIVAGFAHGALLAAPITHQTRAEFFRQHARQCALRGSDLRDAE